MLKICSAVFGSHECIEMWLVDCFMALMRDYLRVCNTSFLILSVRHERTYADEGSAMPALHGIHGLAGDLGYLFKCHVLLVMEHDH